MSSASVRRLPGRTLVLAAAMAALSANTFATEPPSAEEMWRIIQAQQKQIEELKGQLSKTDQKVEATGEALEQVSTASASSGQGSTSASWAERTQIGGYGEMHYNNLEGSGGASDKDEIDFHRFVLYLGHQFNDNIRFFSEFEIEHGGVESDGSTLDGEVEIEQAYVEFDINDQHRAKAGVFLLPIGIINETHEPNTFYGVERNQVESKIIPATWWAGGAAVGGEIGSGFSYDLALHEGLNTDSAASYKPRDGRQKTSEATAKDFAYTARLKWTGMPGVEVGGSFQYQTDMTQSNDPTAGSANLYELHTVLSKGPLGLRALYAMWDLEGSGPASIGADEQLGWYIEPSYKLNEKWGVFARYSLWDNRAGDSTDSEEKQVDVGMNFWPHPDVVIKADYQTQDNDSGREQDGFNLGVGYQF
ncbi:MAG: OprO/OprP family phosphate-selective porin [Gammaproteobacteria bacterium]|nr:OprO/OprP family phosphate-selective porin [Gammaproteobacteria bacterium]